MQHPFPVISTRAEFDDMLVDWALTLLSLESRQSTTNSTWHWRA